MTYEIRVITFFGNRATFLRDSLEEAKKGLEEILAIAKRNDEPLEYFEIYDSFMGVVVND